MAEYFPAKSITSSPCLLFQLLCPAEGRAGKDHTDVPDRETQVPAHRCQPCPPDIILTVQPVAALRLPGKPHDALFDVVLQLPLGDARVLFHLPDGHFRGICAAHVQFPLFK